jgi:hypothetical protein
MSNLPSLYSSVAVKGKTNRTSSAARAEELGLSCLGYLRAFRHLSTNLGERVPSNAGLQLRRAISIQPEGIKLFEKYAIAPSAARLCYVATGAPTISISGLRVDATSIIWFNVTTS